MSSSSGHRKRSATTGNQLHEWLDKRICNRDREQRRVHNPWNCKTARAPSRRGWEPRRTNYAEREREYDREQRDRQREKEERRKSIRESEANERHCAVKERLEHRHRREGRPEKENEQRERRTSEESQGEGTRRRSKTMPSQEDNNNVSLTAELEHEEVIVREQQEQNETQQQPEENETTDAQLDELFGYEKYLGCFNDELKARLDLICSLSKEEYLQKQTLDMESFFAAVTARPLPDVDKALLYLRDPKTLIDLEEKDSTGMTLLMVCCLHRCSPYHDYCTIIDALIARGAKRNATNSSLETALIIATKKGLLCRVCKLIQHSVHVNCVDSLGETALTYAARRKDDRITKRLIKAGADPAYRGFSGKTALDIARRDQTFKLTLLLTEHNRKLDVAIQSGLYEASGRQMPFVIDDDPPLERVHLYPVREQEQATIRFKSSLDGQTILGTRRVAAIIFGVADLSRDTPICRMGEKTPVEMIYFNGVKCHLKAPAPGLSKWYGKLMPLSTHKLNEVKIEFKKGVKDGDRYFNDILMVKICFVTFEK